MDGCDSQGEIAQNAIVGFTLCSRVFDSKGQRVGIQVRFTLTDWKEFFIEILMYGYWINPQVFLVKEGQNLPFI
jgi:hypothetical protein